MTQTVLTSEEAAYRQLVEWCARIERRRRQAVPAEQTAYIEATPSPSATAQQAGKAPTRVA
jgi:hypothetical protein